MAKIILILFCVITRLTSAGQAYAPSYDTASKYVERRSDSCVYLFADAGFMEKFSADKVYEAAVCNNKIGNTAIVYPLLEMAIKKGRRLSDVKLDPEFENLHQAKEWKSFIGKQIELRKKQLAPLSNYNEALILLDLYESDQLIRVRISKAINDNDTILRNKLWPLMKPSDSINIVKLIKIIDKMGWPDYSRVGQEAGDAAFFVMQHAPREIMEKYFPLVEDAAKRQQMSLSNYAKMKDRMLVNRGKKQVYGTQRFWEGKSATYVFFPIDDEKNVNKRRKEVGLEPLPDF